MRDRRPILLLVAVLGLGLLMAGWALYQQTARLGSNEQTIRQQNEDAAAADEKARQERARMQSELQALERLVRDLGGTPPPRSGTAPTPARAADPTPAPAPQRPPAASPQRPTSPSPRPTPSPTQGAPSPSPSASPSPSCLVTIAGVCVGGSD